MRGGKRRGAGRRAGGQNKKTLIGREMIEKAKAAGVTPLEYMLAIMRDPNGDPDDRLEAAKAAAPYVHPRLTAIAHTDDPNTAKRLFDRIEVVLVSPEHDRLGNGAAVPGSDKLN